MTQPTTTIAMRSIRPGEVPRDGGTAIQDSPARPVFSGNGAFDYACVTCRTVLAAGMDAEYMTRKVRVRCASCGTVNVAITEDDGACRR